LEARGIAKAKAESILKLLDRRFNNVSSSIREKVLAKRDPIVLDSLMDQVFDCGSIGEFADLL
jgi:hypothetical protein